MKVEGEVVLFLFSISNTQTYFVVIFLHKLFQTLLNYSPILAWSLRRIFKPCSLVAYYRKQYSAHSASI